MPNTLSFAIPVNNTLFKIIKLLKRETLQYKIIKTKTVQDEIELLNLLFEKYDAEHNTFDDADPIELLKSLIKEHNIKAVKLAKLLRVSEGLITDILNYKKGLSKETIRSLSEKFKLSQEAFNRLYELKVIARPILKRTSRMKNTRKKLVTA